VYRLLLRQEDKHYTFWKKHIFFSHV
jgi:hypothetical protein